jgi:hypothetical protein
LTIAGAACGRGKRSRGTEFNQHWGGISRVSPVEPGARGVNSRYTDG